MKNRGFTLVELAIVLVIVGLLVGGVLQGQELIKQAQIRNTLSQITTLDTAVNTFRAKFKGFPGDLTRGAAFLGGDNGGGDGRLQAVQGAGDATEYGDYAGEIADFWEHLSLANLTQGSLVDTLADLGSGSAVDAGPQTNFPSSEIGTGVIALTDDAGLYRWVIGVSSYLATIDAAEEGAGSVMGNTLTAEESFGIDSKIDDGDPETGSVIAVDAYNGTTAVFTAEADDCVNASEYDLTDETEQCTITIRASI